CRRCRRGGPGGNGTSRPGCRRRRGAHRPRLGGEGRAARRRGGPRRGRCGARCRGSPAPRVALARRAAMSEPVEPALTSTDSTPPERTAEAALRPRRLDEFVGQKVVREQLSLVLDAAAGRGGSPEHVLLSGPPGLGKTTLAMIIAAELSAPLRITSGPAIQHAGDLAAILSSLDEGEVLFLDEIHRLARPAEEMLYIAMEDFRVD